MIEKYIKILVLWLHIYGAIDEDDEELYEYAAYISIITIFPLILSIFIGYIMERGINGILIMIPFLLIRKFSGGFHTKRAWSCSILSILVMVCLIYLTRYCKVNIYFNFVIFLSICTIIVMSPSDSEKRKLDTREKKIYKIIASVLAIIFGSIYIILCACDQKEYAASIALGIMLTALMQNIYFFQKLLMANTNQKEEKNVV